MRLSATNLSWNYHHKRTALSPYRYALAGANIIPSSEASLGGSRYVRASRVIGTVGSGDLSTIRLVDQGWYISTDRTVNASNPVTRRVWIKCVGKPSVLATWGGSASLTVNPGDIELLSDVITPSQLGLTDGVIPRGTRIVVTVETTASVGGKTITCPGMVSGSGTLYCLEYDPAAGFVTNLSTGDAGFTWSGSVSNSPVLWNCVRVVGTFAGGDKRSVLGIGDSIVEGVGSTSRPNIGGGSYFDRALFQTDLNTNVAIAGCNTGCSGGVSTAWNIDGTALARLSTIAKYANTYVEEYGINNIGFSGGQTLADLVYSSSKTLWDTVRVAGQAPGGLPIVIHRPSVLNRTSTDGLTPQSGCGLGGTLDLLNQMFDTRAGTDVTTYINMRNIGLFLGNDVTQNSNYQWNTAYSTDGLHPNESGHILLASILRNGLYSL